jgi:protease I
MVLPQKDYQEMEFNEPKAVFESYGLTVKVASKTAGTATGMSGENATIDLPLKDVDLSQYQAVVFVGGMGIDDLKLYEDQEYISLAKKAKQAGLVVGAICLAPKILANADLLKDRNATASDPDYLKSKGAKVQDLDVVRDGYIITGSGPDASQRFGEEIVATIRERNAPISQEDLTGALRVPLEGVTPEEGEEGNLSSETVTSKPVDLGPKYKCTKCSYVYDPAVGDPDNGIPAGTPFSKLPSTWKCPWCGASKSQFRKA